MWEALHPIKEARRIFWESLGEDPLKAWVGAVGKWEQQLDQIIADAKKDESRYEELKNRVGEDAVGKLVAILKALAHIIHDNRQPALLFGQAVLKWADCAGLEEVGDLLEEVGDLKVRVVGVSRVLL